MRRVGVTLAAGDVKHQPLLQLFSEGAEHEGVNKHEGGGKQLLLCWGSPRGGFPCIELDIQFETNRIRLQR